MKTRISVRVTALTVGALCLTAGGIGLAGHQRSQDATLVGEFADASPLESGSQIRLSGVNVGAVDQVELRDGTARVTFTVDPSVLPVHEDARLVIRPVNLLGESYVELEPGTPSKPYLDPATIPLERTSTRVTLEDVLNTFDSPTSSALAVMVTVLGEGMHDSGPQVAAALKALEPAMRNTGRLADLLDGQNSTLTELVDNAAAVARAVSADEGRVLDDTLDSTEQMLTAVAANKAALRDTLADLPATLVSARTTLRGLAGTAEAAAPTLEAMRPLTDDLEQVAVELRRFADAADPAFSSLRPVLEKADELLRQVGPAVADLRRAGPNLRSAAKDLRPLGETILDHHLNDLMLFVKKWALSTNGRDALGHYFRGVAWVTPDTLSGMLKPPPEPQPRKGKVRNGLLGSLSLPQLPGILPGLTDDLLGATGLTAQQEQSLLGQLLGGN